MSLRRFAEWAGVSLKAVQRRIEAGALPTSTQKILGDWMVLDAELAIAEWQAHTRPRVSSELDGAEDDDPPTPTALAATSPLAAAALRERLARAETMELELKRRSGEVVPIRHVEMRWTARVLGARTKFLGFPTQAKQRLPHLTVADLAVLDQLVREVLEELAGERLEDS